MTVRTLVDRRQADVMAGRICAAAGLSARAESQLLELIGEFDAVDAIRWWVDLKSLAHWLSWSCSMTPGTAREHVRVARALRRMPTVAAAFREGRLSYSKVREVTRVVGVVEEERLCALALTATASQLARMLSAYRHAPGSRIASERKRTLSWREREDGMIDFRLRLPKDQAATVLAALSAAKDQFGAAPAAPCPDRYGDGDGDGTDGPAVGEVDGPVDAAPRYGYVDAMVDVAATFLSASPPDRSGEDRTLVVVHIAAEQLAGSDQTPGIEAADEPAVASPVAAIPVGTGPVAGADTPVAGGRGPGDPAADVPAGTSQTLPGRDQVCQIQGLGGIERETARRLACDADLVGAVIAANGDVLALGRTRRLASRPQRRALMIRDGMCQFPSCHQTRHLDAHHIVAWSAGGPTDLDNLILLCRFHHTAVHEGGMTIIPADDFGTSGRWQFVMPDGRPHQIWRTSDGLANLLARQSGMPHADREERAAIIDAVDGVRHPDARRILPGWRGERFDLHECVQALFRMQLSDDDQEHSGDEQAAA